MRPLLKEFRRGQGHLPQVAPRTEVYEPLVEKGELHLRVLDRMRRKAYEEVPGPTPPPSRAGLSAVRALLSFERTFYRRVVS